MQLIKVNKSIEFTKKKGPFGIYHYWSDEEISKNPNYQWLRITRVPPKIRRDLGLEPWVKFQLNGYTHQLTQLTTQSFESLAEAEKWAKRLIR